MNVSNDWLRKHDACTDGYRWAQTQDNREFGAFVRACAAERFDWAVWVITKRATKEQNAQLAIYCAELALPTYETKYPEDNRPRKAIEAAKVWLADPSKKKAAYAVADAYDDDAYAAARDAARDANDAAAAAAYAAYDAYTAAAYVADATAVAYAAAYAAYDEAAAYDDAATAAARAVSGSEKAIIMYGLSLFKDGAE